MDKKGRISIVINKYAGPSRIQNILLKKLHFDPNQEQDILYLDKTIKKCKLDGGLKLFLNIIFVEGPIYLYAFRDTLSFKYCSVL